MPVIEHPVHKSIVYHPSLLPNHRGASAINWTLMAVRPGHAGVRVEIEVGFAGVRAEVGFSGGRVEVGVCWVERQGRSLLG